MCSELLFAMPTDESSRAPTRPPKVSFASRKTILGSSDLPPLAVSSFQGRKRRSNRLDSLDDGNSRPRKLFSEDSARNGDMVARLPVSISPSSGAMADAILHNRISIRRLSSALLNSPRDFDSGPAAAPDVPRFPAFPPSVPERSDRSLPPVSSAPVVSSRFLTARPSGSCCLGGLRGSSPSPNSPFSPI